MMSNIYPIILSGGSGTRLWPLSRKHYPKQFLRLTSSYTMLQETALRLTGFNKPIAVCNESHRFILAEQLQEIGQTPTSIILEPVARNTAPAIALAAFKALEENENAIMVVLAADHVIEDKLAFQNAVEKAAKYAEQDRIVTFGIIPNSPETGFGYIEANKNDGEIKNIACFVEKPNKQRAMEYVASGNYYWNSGMFVVKASVYLKELKQFNNEIHNFAKQAYVNAESLVIKPSDSIFCANSLL